MVIGADQSDDKDIVITGSKDHYIKVRTVGKLSGGHQAAIMVIGVDHSDDKDIVITGSKDHYIKVRTVGALKPKVSA